jgi:hypothetical protein
VAGASTSSARAPPGQLVQTLDRFVGAGEILDLVAQQPGPHGGHRLGYGFLEVGVVLDQQLLQPAAAFAGQAHQFRQDPHVGVSEQVFGVRTR